MRLDAAYWAAMRAWFIETGATERQIDHFAAFVVCCLVMVTRPRSAERHEHIDLIANHLARTRRGCPPRRSGPVRAGRLSVSRHRALGASAVIHLTLTLARRSAHSKPERRRASPAVDAPEPSAARTADDLPADPTLLCADCRPPRQRPMRSGKTTWARQQGVPIVNPDAIRPALHGQRFEPRAESVVWAHLRYVDEISPDHKR